MIDCPAYCWQYPASFQNYLPPTTANLTLLKASCQKDNDIFKEIKAAMWYNAKKKLKNIDLEQSLLRKTY